MKNSFCLISVLLTSLFVLEANSATVPFFPSSSHPFGQGFVRVINHSDRSGEIFVHATDDAGAAFGPITLPIGAYKTVHFNSEDLEVGDSGKGLPGGIGAGAGDWRLEITGDFNFEVLAYMRTEDGFLTSMVEAVPGIGNRYRIPVFNPGSNRSQISMLRVVNPGSESADLHRLREGLSVLRLRIYA